MPIWVWLPLIAIAALGLVLFVRHLARRARDRRVVEEFHEWGAGEGRLHYEKLRRSIADAVQPEAPKEGVSVGLSRRENPVCPSCGERVDRQQRIEKLKRKDPFSKSPIERTGPTTWTATVACPTCRAPIIILGVASELET